MARAPTTYHMRLAGQPGGSKPVQIAALDVGSYKVTCIIAVAGERMEDHGPSIRITGVGHQMCQGLKNGVVVDVGATATAIRAAVDNAEVMARTQIDSVFVNVSCGDIRSHTISVGVNVGGHRIVDADLSRVLRDAVAAANTTERQIIHSIPTGYTVDGHSGSRDPRGMFADELGVNLHIVTASQGPVRNLVAAVHSASLGVDGLVATAYASGMGVLSETEMDLGATLIDMGAGTTSIGVFYENCMLYTATIPRGGAHVTSDLAYGLRTSLAEAERIKVRHGGAELIGNDGRKQVEYRQDGDDPNDPPYQIDASALPGFIGPRVEETLEAVYDTLKAAGLHRLAGQTIVLTGGASQLAGVDRVVDKIMGKSVRLAHRPLRLTNLPEIANQPGYATCGGLLSYAVRSPLEALELKDAADAAGGHSAFARFGQWLKRAF